MYKENGGMENPFAATQKATVEEVEKTAAGRNAEHSVLGRLSKGKIGPNTTMGVLHEMATNDYEQVVFEEESAKEESGMTEAEALDYRIRKIRAGVEPRNEKVNTEFNELPVVYLDTRKSEHGMEEGTERQVERIMKLFRRDEGGMEYHEDGTGFYRFSNGIVFLDRQDDESHCCFFGDYKTNEYLVIGLSRRLEEMKNDGFVEGESISPGQSREEMKKMLMELSMRMPDEE
ncbi:MAG: hypothetical protein HGA31_04260 [Candidatus Moranbacteria bacterium]|nr:hypothetical protein [Candidatus Moranbacteria bacterium]